MRSCICLTVLFSSMRLVGTVAATEPAANACSDRFYCGFYMYAMDEASAQKMAAAGFNAAYVTGGLRQERPWPSAKTESDFTNALRIARKYQMKLVVQAQGDYDYLNPDNTREQIGQVLVPRAVAFLKKYASEPEFLAYSVKEEPKPDLLGRLGFYHAEILRHVPSVRLFMLHNKLNAAITHPEPTPAIMGMDLYCFFNTTWHNLNIQPPRFALEWFRDRCHESWLATAFARNNTMVTVITGSPYWEAPLTDEAFQNLPLDAQRDIARYVETGAYGWTRDARAKVYLRPACYRAPPNCMRAMAWIAVMEGSKMLLHWPWSHMIDMPDEISPRRGFTLRISDEQFEEFAEACRVFRNHERLIMRMNKERIPLMHCDDPSLYHRAHFIKLDTGQGLVQVLVNTDVGTWHGESRNKYGRPDRPFSVDRRGVLQEFTQASGLRTFRFTLSTHPGSSVWDVTGNRKLSPVEQDGAECYEIGLKPGDGAILFAGTDAMYREVLK